MRVLMTRVLAIAGVALLALAADALATVNGLHFTLFPFGGYANFAKNVNLEDEPIYGGKFGVMFHRYVGIEGHYAWCSTEMPDGTTLWSPGAAFSGIPTVSADANHYGVNLIVNLRPSAYFNPYLLGGWAEAKIDRDSTGLDEEPIYENGLEFGGGVIIRFNDRLAARAEFRDNMWKFPATSPPGDDGVDNQFYTAGLVFALGGSTSDADTDADGVPDRKDKCADTPAGCRVDDRGCPIDTDKDGVCDGVDQCPDTPAGTQVDARGCPRDADNDKVPDGVDQCADTPAGCQVDARGCPVDTDRDGVCDGLDQCPDTPANTRVDARGCPDVRDSDNDTVPDDRDLCPDTPAGLRVDAQGCPIEVLETEKIFMDTGMIRLEDAKFETAKADIMEDDKPRLDTVGQVLLRWPDVKIEIGGHADWRGSRDYNQKLSEQRVSSVLEYLVTRFPNLRRDQYTARGYGEDKPIATNKTDAGMAKNRRVEFVVLNKEAFQQEVQRRRLLRQGEGAPSDTTGR